MTMKLKRFLIVCGVLACGPSVDTPPATSAASEKSEAAPASSLATALRGDPAPGWPGIGPASSMPMDHHHMMPGMNMEGMDMKDGGHGP